MLVGVTRVLALLVNVRDAGEQTDLVNLLTWIYFCKS